MSFPCICRRRNSDDGDGDVLQHLLLRHRGLVRLLLHRLLRRHPRPPLEHVWYACAGCALIRNLQNDKNVNIHVLQGDHSGWLQPPVDLVPTVLAASGRYCSYLLPRQVDGTFKT